VKTCITCGKAKADEDFGLYRKGGTRRRTECRDCDRERKRARREAIQAGTWVGKKKRVPTGELRTCVRCEVEKDTSLFDRDSSRLDGLHSYCKTCRSAHNTAYLIGGPSHESAVR